MHPTTETDVLVIGGGPSGSTLATFLVKKGLSVQLFEKEKFPREHVGESLLPFCYSLFEELGVIDEMKARFVRKPGVKFTSPDGSSQTTYCFGHVIKDESFLSFHVLRAEFDQMLLENARKNGAVAQEGSKVINVDLDNPEEVTVTVQDMEKNKSTHKARFLVDASGQFSYLSKKMGWKKSFEHLDRIAFSTHWNLEEFTESLKEGILEIVYLGGDKKGWIWVIPVGYGRISVGVVLNNGYVREQKARLKQKGVKDWAQAIYEQELGLSEQVMGILKNAHIRQELMINGDYSYYSEKKFGENFAIVGDAAAFLDPIFASGIYLGMNSAKLVAEGIAKKLKFSDSGHSLKEAYDIVAGSYVLIERFIKMFYNPEALNLAEFGTVDHLRHDTAFSLVHYLLAGDFFNKNKEYMTFLDKLGDPKQFARYKHLILDKPSHKTSTCDMNFQDVFPEMIKSLK